MDIDKKKCVGCGNCHVVCTMGAISLDADGRSVVNQEECVECGTCHRVLRNEGYPPWFVRAIRKMLAPLKLGYLADADLVPQAPSPPPNSPCRGSCAPSSATPPSSIREPECRAGELTRSRATM